MISSGTGQLQSDNSGQLQSTRWKVLWESTTPRERLSPTLGNTRHTYYYRSIKCKQSPVYGVFWPLLPHPSTDRNETRTWSSLSPSTIFLSWSQTDRQTHKPTPVKTYSLAFAGRKKFSQCLVLHFPGSVYIVGGDYSETRLRRNYVTTAFIHLLRQEDSIKNTQVYKHLGLSINIAHSIEERFSDSKRVQVINS